MCEIPIIKAPFTEEQVKYLNELQQSKRVHEYTCCSPKEIKQCQRRSGQNNGILTATTEGWICPCGKYKQNWAYEINNT